MGFLSGVSWGDNPGAGVIQAVRMKKKAGEKILKFLADAAVMDRLINENQVVCRYATIEL